MKIDVERLVPPLLAALVLLFTLNATFAALKKSGTWSTHTRGAVARVEDPYAALDRELARPPSGPPLDQLRDPFAYQAAPRPISVRSGPMPPPKPAAPEAPVLTAIIWDNDPRATIHYDHRDFSVRENSLFADFRVTRITSTQVVLARNGEPMVLTLRSKGE